MKPAKQDLKKENITVEDLKTWTPEDEQIKQAKTMAVMVLSQNSFEELEGYFNYLNNGMKFGYNTEFDARKDIVKDNYANKKERFYGNNEVEGPDAEHGTHVAGIIAAERSNNAKMLGVADNVKIMTLRTVPNGDERDKDIANSIIYAVDNGARVINMSFGKEYSPEKDIVDKAVKYAEKKKVLQ
jgi:subtilisin family serine protease